MSKAKPYHHGSFPRTFDKHEPPEIVEEFHNVSKKTKEVVMHWYIRQKDFDTVRFHHQKLNRYTYLSVWNGRMKVVHWKRGYKNRRAALQSLEAIRNSCLEYKGDKLINYKIIEL